MTKAARWRVGIVVVLAVATVAALVIRQPAQAPSLTLVFERYSTRMDFYIPDVAFLWLTNDSGKSYYLAMTGNTDTHQSDTPISLGHYKASNSGSVMVDCCFSDRTPTGTSNWTQRVSFTNASMCVGVAPHSAIRLRVPLPPEGQKRKVAALCAELPAGPSQFWTSGIGLSILRLLPRSVGKKIIQSRFTVQKVWCDRELSHPDDRLSIK